MEKEIIGLIEKYAVLLSEHFDLEKVILYGSYAKGTAKADSDIDVAIIVDKIKGDFFSYAPLLWKLRRQIDDRIEPIIFEKGKDKSGFLSYIIKNGIEITL